MICCQLNQTIFILCNHFYELNLHQFHKDQQFLANHLMISTCLKMIHFLIIFCQEGIQLFWTLCVHVKNTMSCKRKKKNEKHMKKKKKPVHSLIFLTRFSRDELFAVWTESDNFYSLQSLPWMKLTSVPQRSTVFLQIIWW